ncbi:MAG: S8 family serine peptidase, partial [Acidobacteriota bacterium]
GLVGDVDMQHFSSTGPTEDGSGRIKPDVVSTGCALSACGNDDDTYCDGLNGFVSGRGLSYKCGTSMATPTVAGGAALVRQYLREGWYPCGAPGCASPEYTYPSAALLKALIINGTHVPYGAHYGDALPAWGDPVPNARVGFGWVNLENSLYFDGDRLHTTILADLESTDGAAGPGLETGSTHTYYLNVTGAEPLRITLAWTDPAGNTVGDALVNDLNLRVTAPDGTIYRGNSWRLEFLGQVHWYSAPDSTTPDNLNNVEAIYLPEPAAGIWTVRVDGASVPGRAVACDAPCSQGYALVASGHFRDLAADPGAGHLMATEYGISAGCDGDTYLDNGERATLQITVRNFGASTATLGAVTPFVATDSKLPASYVAISPPTWLLGNVPAGAEATASFQVRFLEHPDNLSGEYLKLRMNYGWDLAAGHASEFLSIPLQASEPSSPFYNETFESAAPGDPPAGWTTEWGNHTCSGSWCMPDTFSGWMAGAPPQVVSCDAEGPRDTVGQELKFGAGDCVTTIPCCQEEWAKGPNLFLLLNQMTELSYSHRLDSPSFLSGLYLDPDGSLSDNLHASKAKMPYSSTGNRPWDRYRADLRALQKIRGLYFNLEFYNGSAGSPAAGEQGSLIDDIRIDTFDYDPANADSGPPDSTTPPAGTTGISVRPDLGWDHVPDHGGRTYAARVCDDPSCTDVIWSESGLTGNLVSIFPSLPSVQTHYWQTMVEDDCAVGDWGEMWSFTTAQADFDLGVPSGTITIPRYSSEVLTVTASWLNGYDGDVMFSCTNLPSNVDCSFTPNPVPWVDGTAVTTTSMTITAGSVATGNYSFQVVATGIVDGSVVTRSRARTLQIEGGPPGEARNLRLTPQQDDSIQISWLSSNCDVQDYAVYMGDLDRLSSGIYSHDTRLTCSTGGAKSFSLVPGALATHDFEDGLQGWTTASLGCASNLWKRTNTCAQQSWGLYFGNTGSCTYDTADRVCGAIVSPDIDLKGIDYATLAFDYRLDTERGSGYDVVRVEIRRAGTSTWSVLAHNQPPSTGGLLDDDRWHHASFRIDGYTGSNVEIRFTFDTVDEVGNDYRGFLVDNVAVGNQPENAYFLTTPINVTFEGSYGPHPDGGERPRSGRACRSVQNTADCN